MDRPLISLLITFFFLTGPQPRAVGAVLPKNETPGTVWVQVQSDDPASVWKARAFQESIAAHLSVFHRIILKSELQPIHGCNEGETSCLLLAARQQGINAVILGRVRGKTLSVSNYETWTRTLVSTEEFRFGSGVSMEEFRHRLFQLMKPFIQIGGLIDQHIEKPQVDSGSEAEIAAFSPAKFGTLAFFFFALFWLPRLISLSFKDFKASDRLKRLNVVYSLLVPGFWTALLVVSATSWGAMLVRAVPAWKFLIAGAAWAVCLRVLRGATMPRVHSLSEINYLSIFPVTTAWLGVTLGRLPAVALAFAPFLLAARTAAKTLGSDNAMVWTFIAPITILAGCAWYQLWIEHIALLANIKSNAKGFRGGVREILRKYFFKFLDRRSIDVTERVYQLDHQKRRFILAPIAAAAIATVMWSLAKESIRYHSTYAARMDDIKHKIELQKRLQQEHGNGTR